jgi:F420H(2)-dependent biliverdin reductase
MAGSKGHSMSSDLTPEAATKLEKQQNIWFGSVRADGTPHLTPIWFVWHEGKLYIGIDPNSVKSHNLRQNPRVVLALEDGSHPVICEGIAATVLPPLPETLAAAFLSKYEWDLTKEAQYNQVVEVTPVKWLIW